MPVLLNQSAISFTHLLATGVVEVLAGGENLDCLRSALHQLIQQAGMQPFLHQHVRWAPVFVAHGEYDLRVPIDTPATWLED